MNERTERERTRKLEGALVRLISAYLGGAALVGTYAVATVSGVAAPTAVLRAAATSVVFVIIGRVFGRFIVRPVVVIAREKAQAPTPERGS